MHRGELRVPEQCRGQRWPRRRGACACERECDLRQLPVQSEQGPERQLSGRGDLCGERDADDHELRVQREHGREGCVGAVRRHLPERGREPVSECFDCGDAILHGHIEYGAGVLEFSCRLSTRQPAAPRQGGIRHSGRGIPHDRGLNDRQLPCTRPGVVGGQQHGLLPLLLPGRARRSRPCLVKRRRVRAAHNSLWL